MYMVMLKHKTPCPGIHEIYNFGRPFRGHLYYTLGLSDLCLGVKKIFKEIMHFHYLTYMAMTYQKNPCAGVMNLTLLVDHSLVIVTTYLVCLIYAWEWRSRFLKK